MRRLLWVQESCELRGGLSLRTLVESSAHDHALHHEEGPHSQQEQRSQHSKPLEQTWSEEEEAPDEKE